MVTTLCFYLYPIQAFLKTLATTSYTLLVYYVLHVASPRINEAKYYIISHVAYTYTCIKNTAAIVLSLYYSCHICLNMNDLVQLECLKLACVFLTSPDFLIAICRLQRLKDRFQATGAVKD